MAKDNSNKDFRNASFKNEDLAYANFSGSNLRGADFTGSDLTGADLSNSRTGITPTNAVYIFLVALAVSLLSGYIAMLAGHTMQELLHSNEKRLKIAGWVTVVVVILFIIYSIWKGVGSAIRHLIIPVCSILIILGVIALVTGLGTGSGVFYVILSFLLTVVMFVVGTIARAAAGSLSDILFTVVALAGGVFGKTVGGGVGTVIMALSCMAISKRALAGAKGFESLRKVAAFITVKFGTSFRKSRLVNTNFSHSKVRNADFTDANISSVNWGNSKKFNCINNNDLISNSKKHKHG